MNSLLKRINESRWNYWIGALVLAVLNLLVFFIQQKPWGITSIIESWTRWFGQSIGILKGEEEFFVLLSTPSTYIIAGIILGAFLSVLLSSQARLRPIRNRKYLFAALLGGLLMGYGARLAQGCNIGAFLNGVSSASITGWVFGLFVFLGALIGGKLLLKYLL